MYLKVKIVEIWIFVYKFDSQKYSHKIYFRKHFYNFYAVVKFCKNSLITTCYIKDFIFVYVPISVSYKLYLKLCSNLYTPFYLHAYPIRGTVGILYILICLFSNALTDIICCIGGDKHPSTWIIAAGTCMMVL